MAICGRNVPPAPTPSRVVRAPGLVAGDASSRAVISATSRLSSTTSTRVPDTGFALPRGTPRAPVTARRDTGGRRKPHRRTRCRDRAPSLCARDGSAVQLGERSHQRQSHSESALGAVAVRAPPARTSRTPREKRLVDAHPGVANAEHDVIVFAAPRSPRPSRRRREARRVGEQVVDDLRETHLVSFDGESRRRDGDLEPVLPRLRGVLASPPRLRYHGARARGAAG